MFSCVINIPFPLDRTRGSLLIPSHLSAPKSDKSVMRHVSHVYYSIERISIECRKTKTKVITLANQKGRRQSGKPIKTRSNYA